MVVQTGWLEKFPTLKAAVLESNASWLPLVLARSSNFSNLFAFQRGNRLIRDPVEVFNERCFIGFESDETLVYRLWDVFQDVAHLVVGLSAPRRGGRVGRPAPHGRVQRAAEAPAEAAGRERARALRHRARDGREGTHEGPRPAILPW